MLVQKWMSKNVIKIDVDETLANAIFLMREHDIHVLPVIHKDNLVGIISDRDIKRASASDANSLEIHELLYLIHQIKIKDIMTKNPITVPYNYTIEEAAEILLNYNLSAVPVRGTNGKIVGIITKNDIFRQMVSLTGLEKRGVLFALKVEDRPGSIKEISDLLREYGGRMASILTSYDDTPEGFRNVYIRVYNLERDRLDHLIEELKAKAKLYYVIDHTNNKRIIFGLPLGESEVHSTYRFLGNL